MENAELGLSGSGVAKVQSSALKAARNRDIGWEAFRRSFDNRGYFRVFLKVRRSIRSLWMKHWTITEIPHSSPESGLKEKYDKAMRRNDVKAIVVTGNGSIFSGGFDINVLQEVQQTGNLSHLGRVSVDLMINTIEGDLHLQGSRMAPAFK